MIIPGFDSHPPLILIVDDEKTIRLVLRQAMEKEGYRVAEAANGEQCLELCQRLQPDMVLLDAMLPGIDGFSCCAQLPTLLKDECPTVLMITTLNDKASVDRAFEVGAADYITKPIDWPVLYQRVRRLLQTRWAMAQMQRHLKVQADLAFQMSHANTALQAEIAERKQAEKKIQESLQEKEVLLKEIHHRVKNNLQIISGLFYLQARYTKDEQVLQLLRENQARLQSMALIHEKLYGSESLKEIDFKDYISSLMQTLFVSYSINGKAIALKVNCQQVYLNIDMAISCGLIINELVCNSLKHAFVSSSVGEVAVDFYQNDRNVFELIVRDNGIGIPAEIDFQKSNSLVLRLINSLVTRQLEGIIQLDRSGGTKFTICWNL